MIALKSLAVISRALSTLLDTGVAVDQAIDVAAGKLPDRRARDVLLKVRNSIRNGSDLESALRNQEDAFPELMIDLVAVGEKTGHLPEVLKSLSNHFENSLRMRKTFIAAITWPAIQFSAAVLIIAFLILILGWVGESTGGQTVDVLGWGLTGTSGALTWLFGVGLFVGSLVALYVGFRKSMKWRKLLDPYPLRVPVLGNTMKSFAIARFSWAFSLTQKAGMTLAPSLKASLKATSNGAFIDAGRPIWNALKSGSTFTESIRSVGLFPEDFLHMVGASESAGTVPEALERLSPQFEEDARRSLKGLVVTLGWIVWIMVAAFIIFVVFSIAMWYVGLLNNAVNDAFG